MKFDTKTSKTMPVSPEHCFVRPNKYVPSTTDSEAGSRQVYYQATIVFTPIYASSRIHENEIASGRKQLLAESDVDSLSHQLEALLLSDDIAVVRDDEEAKEDEETKEEEPTVKPAKKQVRFQPKPVASGLGRWFFQSEDQKTLSRSLRVAHK